MGANGKTLPSDRTLFPFKVGEVRCRHDYLGGKHRAVLKEEFSPLGESGSMWSREFACCEHAKHRLELGFGNRCVGTRLQELRREPGLVFGAGSTLSEEEDVIDV